MSLLPKHFLGSTVVIKHGTKAVGSGFLYGLKAEEKKANSGYAVFLVTNKHIADIKQLSISFNTKRNKTNDAIVGDENWVFHDNNSIDIAIARLNSKYLEENDLDFSIVTSEHSINSKKDFLEKLKVGQDLFLTGFPLGVTGIEKNYPIARQGIIARNDEELIADNKIYLDINNFPGNSGGPIFLRPSMIALEGDSPIVTSMIIGVICAYVPSRKTLYDNDKNPPEAKMIIEENSGIAIGIPIYIVYKLAKKTMENQIKKDKKSTKAIQ